MPNKLPDWLVYLRALKTLMPMSKIAVETGLSRRTIQRLINSKGQSPSLDTYKAIERLHAEAFE